MELKSLSENIVTVPYKRGEELVELRVNIDAFTPEFWREIKQVADQRFKQLNRSYKAPTDKPKKKLTANEKSRLEAKLQLQNFEMHAKRLELERETNIEFLVPHVLKGWDVTENGVPVAVSKEVLSQLPPQLVQDLFDVCMEAAQTVKKQQAEERKSLTTSETSDDGTQALRVVGGSSTQTIT